jgi:hypothetical protein
MPTPATWPARLAVLLLCPGVFAAPAPFPRPHRPLSKDQLAGPHTLATLPLHQARQLHGQRATYRVVLDRPGDPEGEHVVSVCKGAGNIERTLWLPADEETEDEMKRILPSRQNTASNLILSTLMRQARSVTL